MNQPFLNDDGDFFKSNTLNDKGRLVKTEKTDIPSVVNEKTVKKVETQSKKTPETVKKFVKDVESTFKKIDGIVKELENEYTDNRSVKEMCLDYIKFKNQLQHTLNRKVNSPTADKVMEAPQGEKDDSRVNIMQGSYY